MANASVLHDGIYFGEGPRWHENRLWYSDFYDHAVHAIDLDGNDERVLEVDQQPSGLGWMPDGSMLVVSMLDRRLLRWDGAQLTEHADLSGVATWHCNDMVVDAAGRAYVGNFGFDLDTFLEEHGVEGVLGDPGPPLAVLAKVDPDGTVTVAAEDIKFPNGAVITPDRRTMILAETLGLRLTAFDIDADGGLSNRRVWADLSSLMCPPDGICLDAEGAVWVANALGAQCLRVEEGGKILDEVTTSQLTFACMLGGPEGRHLFAMTAPGSDHRVAGADRQGRIEVAQVAVPHAGLP
jgi:sugar lactone lactonase YvrE